MAIADLLNVSLLILVIGIGTPIDGCRRLRAAQRAAAEAAQQLEACEQVHRELQEFVLLFNYGATDEAYEHLRTCGFATTEPRPHSSA